MIRAGLIASMALLCASGAWAADDPPTVALPSDPADQGCAQETCRAEREKYRLFPLGADKAIERGYRVPRPWGASVLFIGTVQDMASDNLAIAIAKGDDPPDDRLVDVPFVTTERLRGQSTNTQFKADLWVLPNLNLFVGFGHAEGSVDIGVDIDLDALLPPPICRPANPCGVLQLPFEAKIDNATTTLGMVAAYGGHGWFVTGSAAKTLSVSSKERSDIEALNIGVRGGPRLETRSGASIMPYAGVNYFDFDTTVDGVVRSGPAFPDGDPIALRYRVELSTRNPWSFVAGANAELARHWEMQAEYALGEDSRRLMLSLTFRP